MQELIRARGHDNVTATHESTFEVTTEEYLTPSGDCILAVGADRAPADFGDAFVEACQDPATEIRVTIRVGDAEATVTARGHEDLTFESTRSAVVRTSTYTDDRTVGVAADAAAADIDGGVVRALADGADLEFELRIDA